MNASLLNKLENLGYYALPPRHEHCLGIPGCLSSCAINHQLSRLLSTRKPFISGC